MTVEPDVIAAFLRRSCCAITVDDSRVEKISLMKGRYRIGENGVKTAIGLPSSKGAINACIMNFGTALFILINGQLFPLTAQVKQLQNVIEKGVLGQFWGRTATSRA
jgi:hypothetical protein